MDINNIIIILAFIIIIFLIQKYKADKTSKDITSKKNKQIKDDSDFLKSLNEDCDSKCYICVGIVELLKKKIL